MKNKQHLEQLFTSKKTKKNQVSAELQVLQNPYKDENI